MTQSDKTEIANSFLFGISNGDFDGYFDEIKMRMDKRKAEQERCRAEDIRKYVMQTVGMYGGKVRRINHWKYEVVMTDDAVLAIRTDYDETEIVRGFLFGISNGDFDGHFSEIKMRMDKRKAEKVKEERRRADNVRKAVMKLVESYGGEVHMLNKWRYEITLTDEAVLAYR